MKRFRFIFLFLVFIQYCKAQDMPTASTQFYNKSFNWTLNVPTSFERVSVEDWAKMQNKGKAVMEKAVEQEVENNSKMIFVFRSDKLNYFESSHQAFNPAVDGNHVESIKSINELLYQSFVSAMPGVKVVRSFTTEKVDGVPFYLSRFDIIYPNKMVMHWYMFTHLFGKQEFTANIMYVDEEKGKAMLAFWRGSRFGKK